MSASRVRRTLTRLAYEIVEHNRGGGNLLILGIRERGLVLAHQLVAELAAIEPVSQRAEAIDVRGTTALDPNVSIEGKGVVVIDDVLFSGQTAWTAVEAVLNAGDPLSVQLAVLIDRGHRKFPIQPDFVGKVIPTKYNERVVVDTTDELIVYLEE